MNNFEAKTSLLKNVRLRILAIHKALLDEERKHYEQTNGIITSGQFLNLLVNDENFQWLRVFSTLVVEIDEMLDLDDGFNEAMFDQHLSQIRRLVNLEISDKIFDSRYKNFIRNSPDIALRNSEIKDLLN